MACDGNEIKLEGLGKRKFEVKRGMMWLVVSRN